jgi:hypothetical protein
MVPSFLKLGLWLVLVVSLASLGAIIVFINPYKTGVLMRVLFTTVVFLALFSLFSIIGVWLRRKFISQINSDRILKMVFRQSALLSVMLTAYIWFSHFKLLKIWTAILVLAATIGAEYYFLTRRKYSSDKLNTDIDSRE